MDVRVDPRLRGSAPSDPSSATPALAPISAALGQAQPQSHPPPQHQAIARLPSLPRPALAEHAVRLPPLSDASSASPQLPYYQPQQQPQQQPQPQQQQQQQQQQRPTVGPPPNGNNGSPPVANGAAESPNGDPKRPRACESCRGLKVRCDSDPQNPEGPCRRCAKAGRSCVVTQPSRKRQKKSDSRVAELERKIDALTASLHATRNGTLAADSDSDSYSQNGDGDGDGDDAADARYDGPASLPSRAGSMAEPNGWHHRTLAQDPAKTTPAASAAAAVAGLKRKRSADAASVYLGPRDSQEPRLPPPPPPRRASSERSPASRDEPPNVYPFLMPKGSRTSTASAFNDDARPPPAAAAAAPPGNDFADVIDRRMLSAETAAAIFDGYVRDMTIHFPAVVFAPGTTSSEIRKTRPVLFLAILSVGSGTAYPDLQRALTKELMKVLAERVICNGEKSLELVQALQLSTIWYWPPEHYEELKFYQLIHISAVMAIDLGMGKKHKPAKKKNMGGGVWREVPRKRCGPTNFESSEARRAWLTCYFLSSNVSQSLRRANLIRWTSYMDDCIDVLTDSPDALPSDRLLCQWVRLQHIGDEVGYQFSMDDPCASVGLADVKVQYALKGFERQLDEWKAHLPVEQDTPSLRFNEHIINLYLHEVAMHVDHNIDDFHPPFTEETLRSHGGPNDLLTPTHIDALTACLSSVHGVFDIFCAYEIETVRRLPIFHHVRTAYAVVVLLKMYFAATSQNGELGKVIGKEDMKAEMYLERLLARYRLAAEDERCRPATKFMGVLVMLRTWFQRQEYGSARETPRKPKVHGGCLVAMSSMDCPRMRAAMEEGQDRERAATASSSGSAYPQILSGGDTAPRYSSEAGPAPSHHSDYSNANTPLQLLSEVAMGNPNGIPPTDPPGSNGWYGYANSSTDGTPAPTTYALPNTGATTTTAQPAASMLPDADGPAAAMMPPAEALLEADMGDGYGQAMGMTLGDDGDFSSIFMNDVFFNLTMDGNAPNVFEYIT
ncbi:MAG: hypothetical protein M1832_005456 [Thelocarpon impressellum]|nr:MAG: hypothetical protein M1832_005456 [Thelocarpon impressellum]